MFGGRGTKNTSYAIYANKFNHTRFYPKRQIIPSLVPQPVHKPLWTVLSYIWDEIILCSSTGEGQLWALTGGEAAELKFAVGSWGWEEQPCAGLPVNSTPRDWGKCLFPSFWNLWGQIWCAVSRSGVPSTVKTLHMGDCPGGLSRRLKGGSTNQEYKYVESEELDLFSLKMISLREDLSSINSWENMENVEPDSFQWWAVKWM